MIFYVLTLFPEMIRDSVNHSILKRAADDGLIEVRCVDIRDFSAGRHKQVDDAPYGGGAGMVMMPGPVFYACEYTRGVLGAAAPVYYLTPQGKPYTQRKAEELSKLKCLILLCGHYEGIDQRALDAVSAEEISIGDYVLTGGELAALAVIDSVSRLIPGVLGKTESLQNESFSDGLLEYPQYTRPAYFAGMGIPPELLSGHHKNIAKWRRRQSLLKTAKMRPDLLKGVCLNADDLHCLQGFGEPELNVSRKTGYIISESEKGLFMEDISVIRYFREISKIPRGSGNERQISDWLYGFAKERGLCVIQDAVNNIIIKKPGTKGYEDADTVIIQGHMDMVCEKNKDKRHNFLTDPIRLITEGDIMRADGTTLGADNGIAVAMALALLDAEDIPHPPLEVLLTVDEETGMTGAKALDGSLLAGRKLINMDSEEEGAFIVSCAGGLKTEIKLPVEYMELPGAYILFALRVKGLKGGHSGIDINKGRANSFRLLGRALHAVFSELDVYLGPIHGGMKLNAIPRESEAFIAVKSDERNNAAELIKACETVFRDEFRANDPLIELEFMQADDHDPRVFSKETARKVISVLCLTPLGVTDMSPDIPGLPETSNNLAVIRTDESFVSFTCALRSSVASRKYALKSQIEQLAALAGAGCESEDDYPGWEYSPDSALRETLITLYEEIYGRKPKAEAIHAGLECGLFTCILPGVDMISFGPDIFDAHSPNEHFSISSVERVWDFLTRVISRI